MKDILLRPRSIAGAVLWGAIAACVVFFGLIVADFAWSLYRASFGPPHRVDAIAVGGGYSINIEATPAHPFLAEYQQSVAIYGGTPREGKLLGHVKIPMNTGGRVRIGILVPRDPSKHEVVLLDRYATTRIDLVKRIQLPGEADWRDRALKPLGWISGESYPVKFLPCTVWSLVPLEERDAILDGGSELLGFCNARP
jgi:hypothetical protein